MPDNYKPSLIKSAYDILALALQLKKVSNRANLYVDRNSISYRRTKWGFEKEEKYNLRVALRRKERQLDQLSDAKNDLEQSFTQLTKRKTGLLQHLEAANDKLKQAKKEKGFFKKLIKELLDKNTALDKRMERMQNQADNLQQQVKKLKENKDNLFEQNLNLTEKTRQQKVQITALQKAISELKSKSHEKANS
ncbi:hypothetical protein [Carboxylicivirga sp. M1479]|uniref:hypothetical protein n=1 Tax=Carboxylicivirga sp. M1479 TaxID=2594476 RepID=UPI001177CED0|nr:hypothetical protein [Carboxylicivirga sp. M1479]TRX66000.1 hypothetical protein FNN09_16040 [Carboxylicivirga sp. M1479]